MTKKKKKPAGTKKKVPVRKLKPPKPEFEQALEKIQTDQAGDTRVEPKEVRQDGGRPGPDVQDPGAVESKAPQALAKVLKIPFSIWAGVSEIPEMNLTDPEAEEWAGPMIDLLEYYFPGRIPEIIWIWLMFLSATEKVIDSRVKIRYEKRKERAQTSIASREPATTGPTAGGPQPAPKHNGAEPETEYPKDG